MHITKRIRISQTEKNVTAHVIVYLKPGEFVEVTGDLPVMEARRVVTILRRAFQRAMDDVAEVERNKFGHAEQEWAIVVHHPPTNKYNKMVNRRQGEFLRDPKQGGAIVLRRTHDHARAVAQSRGLLVTDATPRGVLVCLYDDLRGNEDAD